MCIHILKRISRAWLHVPCSGTDIYTIAFLWYCNGLAAERVVNKAFRVVLLVSQAQVQQSAASVGEEVGGGGAGTTTVLSVGLSFLPNYIIGPATAPLGVRL